MSSALRASFLKGLVLLSCIWISTILPGHAKPIEIALIKDGPAQQAFLSEAQIKREVSDLLGSEFSVRFTPSKETTGDWTLKGINRILDKQLSNSKVAFIVTIGAIGSNEIAKRKNLPKPVIAAVTINPVAQQLPIKDNRSTRDNLTFIADMKDAAHEVRFFRDFVGAKRFALVVEPILAKSWPALDRLLATASKQYGVSFTKVTAQGSPEEIAKRIPQDVEAVFIGLLSQFNNQQISALADALIQRRLPSYTFLGEAGVNAGLMVSINQEAQAKTQIARRIAINIQRMLLGKSATELNISMRFPERVIFNRATGLAIDFAPGFDALRDAKIVDNQRFDKTRSFSIQSAVVSALRNNLGLRASRYQWRVAQAELAIAESDLWPQLSLGAAYAQVNEEQVVPGLRPEATTDAQVEFSQILYSEPLRANIDIRRKRVAIERSTLDNANLDLIQETATAYLNVLRASAADSIRKANLELTQLNLELAQNRRRVGSAGQSDILRWQSQLAREKQNVFAAQANKDNANLELARLLNLPPGIKVNTRKPGVTTLLGVVSDNKLDTWIRNEIQWRALQAFYVQEALNNSNDLKQMQEQIGIKTREVTALNRQRYIPDVSAYGQYGRNIDQSGLGSAEVENDSWTVGLRAKLDLDLDGSRRRSRDQSELTLAQLRLRREALQQAIRTRTAQALYQVGASFPSIELAYQAAKAASNSLELVQNAYAKGRVSIADLLDAQNNALNAKLLAADAEYAFLQDFVALMRAASDYEPLLKGHYSEAWLQRLAAYFKSKNIRFTMPMARETQPAKGPTTKPSK